MHHCLPISLEYPYAPWSAALQRGALAVPRYKQFQLLKLKRDLVSNKTVFMSPLLPVCVWQKRETIIERGEEKTEGKK